MFPLLTTGLAERDAFISFLKERNILAVFHYVPLHTSEMGARLGYREGQLPVSEDVSGRLVRLPFFNTLSDDDQRRVIEAVEAFARWVP
jgi:dTDP-4-amino-4,6-dideoxygalactose transaminase